MAMISLKNVSKKAISLVVISLLASCARPGGNIAPIIPERQFSTPDYAVPTSEFGPSLPAGTLPVEMVISGLTDDEKEKKQVTTPVAKVKQFYVDIKLNNNKVLKNYYAVKWSVSTSEVGSINTRGLFTPTREGRTRVIASIGGVSAVIEVIVTSSMNIWAQIISPTTRDLYATKMVSDNEAWAVGQGGTILHYMNGAWTDESAVAAVGGADLTGVDVTETGDAWAVGGSTILKYSGGKWEKFPFSGGGTLKAIDMVNSNDGYIVGSNASGDALVLRYTGGSWQPIESKIKEELNTVCALSGTEVWVGGKSRVLGAPAVFRFDGNQWNRARFNADTIIGNILGAVRPWDGTYEVKAIKMLNSSQGWIVGEYAPVLSTLRGKRGFMFRYDAVKNIWERGTYDKSNQNLEQVPLRNVGMISGGKGWVLGTNTPPNAVFQKQVNDIPGAFLASNGKELKIDTQYQANTVGKSFYGIDILPNGNGVVVGESGFIMHHQYDVSRPNYYNSGNSSSYSNYGSSSYGDGGYGGNTNDGTY